MCFKDNFHTVGVDGCENGKKKHQPSCRYFQLFMGEQKFLNLDSFPLPANYVTFCLFTSGEKPYGSGTTNQ